VTLVPYTGWCCLNCGHRTDRGFPIRSCCGTPVPVRALVEEPDVSMDEYEALAAARDGEVEPTT
jgi:hypothetical protein